MGTFTADEIIGKNLIAIKPVNLYRGSDFDNPVYTVEPGANVGTVLSYLGSKPGRPFLIWQFEDSNGRIYYAKHITGDMKLEKFSGAVSLEEKEQAAQDANQPTGDKIIKTVQKVALIGGLFYLVATAIKSRNQ